MTVLPLSKQSGQYCMARHRRIAVSRSIRTLQAAGRLLIIVQVRQGTYCISRTGLRLRKQCDKAARYLVLLTTAAACAQDLVPRAYLITPTGSNAVTVAHSWNTGDVVFDPSVPIEDARGTFSNASFELLPFVFPARTIVQHRRFGALRARKL